MVCLKDFAHITLPGGSCRFDYLLEVCKQERLLLEKEEQEDKQEKKACYNGDDDQYYLGGVDLNGVDLNGSDSRSSYQRFDYLLAVCKQESLLLEKEKQEDKQEKKACYNDDDQYCGLDLNKSLIIPSNHTVPNKEEWRKKLMGSFYGLSWQNALKSVVPSAARSNTPESVISHSSGTDGSRASLKRRLKYDEVGGEAVAERINSKKRKRGSRVPNNCPEPPPPGLPVKFKNLILQLVGKRAVCVEKLVIQKELTKTDVNSTQNRLSIPARLVREEFLTEEEHLLLCQRSGKNVCSIDEVPLITPMMEVAKVSLRRWEMKKERGVPSVSYVIANTWNEIRRRNKFESKMIVQLWAIRVDVDLWMALVRLS